MILELGMQSCGRAGYTVVDCHGNVQHLDAFPKYLIHNKRAVLEIQKLMLVTPVAMT